jgi:hypothetical protein
MLLGVFYCDQRNAHCNGVFVFSFLSFFLFLVTSATRVATGADSSVQLVATRAIAAGEEVFVSYLETRCLPIH